jgi:hypothetical protein
MLVRPVLIRKSTDPQYRDSLAGNERLSIDSSHSSFSELPGIKGDEYPKSQLGDPENPTVLKNTLAKPKVRKSLAPMIHRSESLKPVTPGNPNFDFEISGRELKFPDLKRKSKMGNPTKNVGPGSYKRKNIQVDLSRDSLGRDSMGNSQREDLRKLIYGIKDQSPLPIEETPPDYTLQGKLDFPNEFGDSEESLEILKSYNPETRATGYKTIN